MVERALTRRQFITAAGLSAGLAATGGLSPVFAARPGGGSAGNLYPLEIPPAYGANGLRAASASVDIGGVTSSVLAYNDLMPGPTIQARRGQTITVPVANDLDEHTTVHWHGLVVPTAVDGQPQDAIAPGASKQYALPIVQRAGMHWYHPHPHLHTATQVVFGLAGAFLVRDAEEDGLGLPTGPYEVPLVVRDANLNKAGNLTYTGKASGFTGSISLVNGTRSPFLAVDRAVYRFRILNGANSRVFRLALSNGAPFTLIGNDGGLLTAPVEVPEIVLSGAERVDVLVDLTGITSPVFLRCLDAGWNLLELRPKKAPATAPYSLPTRTLSTITSLGPPAATRRFSFDGMSRINGAVYDMSTISFEIPAGRVEDWVLTTAGNAPHPVHIHGTMFQVVSRSGGRGRLYPWEGGWKDTVLLMDGETVTVRVKFDLEGRYLMHCHKLEHEDAGMMLNFLVT